MEDATYFRRVINAYRSYGRHSLAVLENKKRQLDRLSTHHQQLLDVAGYTAKIERARHCILKNQNFINRIVGSAAEMENSTSGTSSNMVTDDQMEKIRSTLRQFVREWSMEGQKEREQTFGVVCRRIQALFPSLTKASDIQILVPGAGLGRLAHDIAKLGYNCQGISDFLQVAR
jgi:carnosine N-methyltransferase